MKEGLIEETINKLNNYNDEIQDAIQKANEKLKSLKSSQELIDLVNNYYYDREENLGYPLYLVSKRGSGWCLYSGSIIDKYKAEFLLSDSVSYRVVDYRTAYKYYRFSNWCR